MKMELGSRSNETDRADVPTQGSDRCAEGGRCGQRRSGEAEINAWQQDEP